MVAGLSEGLTLEHGGCYRSMIKGDLLTWPLYFEMALSLLSVTDLPKPWLTAVLDTGSWISSSSCSGGGSHGTEEDRHLLSFVANGEDSDKGKRVVAPGPCMIW